MLHPLPTPLEFIQNKVKKWHEKRFSSNGALIVHYDELEKWLDEYAGLAILNFTPLKRNKDLYRAEEIQILINGTDIKGNSFDYNFSDIDEAQDLLDYFAGALSEEDFNN